jgi:hypothetical protein
VILFPHERIAYPDDVRDGIRVLQPDRRPLPAASGADTAGAPVGQSPATDLPDSPPDPAKVDAGGGRRGMPPTA